MKTFIIIYSLYGKEDDGNKFEDDDYDYYNYNRNYFKWYEQTACSIMSYCLYRQINTLIFSNLLIIFHNNNNSNNNHNGNNHNSNNINNNNNYY